MTQVIIQIHFSLIAVQKLEQSVQRIFELGVESKSLRFLDLLQQQTFQFRRYEKFVLLGDETQTNEYAIGLYLIPISL